MSNQLTLQGGVNSSPSRGNTSAHSALSGAYTNRSNAFDSFQALADNSACRVALLSINRRQTRCPHLQPLLQKTLGGFCCLEPCDRFLRSLGLYTPNIKGKHQQQQREKCTVLQETSATSLSRLQGTESGYLRSLGGLSRAAYRSSHTGKLKYQEK